MAAGVQVPCAAKASDDVRPAFGRLGDEALDPGHGGVDRTGDGRGGERNAEHCRVSAKEASGLGFPCSTGGETYCQRPKITVTLEPDWEQCQYGRRCPGALRGQARSIV